MGEVGRSAHELHDVQQVLGVDDDLDGGQDQYDYFSDEANGMTESKVVDLSFNPRGDADKESITFDDWDKKWDGYGIQRGDLMFFYADNGAALHAAVISKIDETGIYYTANSNRRFDQPLMPTLSNASWEKGVYIVRIKDTF